MKNRRKINIVFYLLILIIIVFSGCSEKEEYDYSKNVLLYDYKSIEIEESFIEINDSDIESIVSLDMSYNECYKPVKNRNSIKGDDIILIDIVSDNKEYCSDNYYYDIENGDFGSKFQEFVIGKTVGGTYKVSDNNNDLKFSFEFTIKGIFESVDIEDEELVKKFYGYDTMEEVKKFITERAQKEIIFNYMWDIVLNNSEIIEFPEEIQGKIDKEYSGDNSKTKDDTSNQEDEELYNHYYEITIAKAILYKENIQINSNNLEELKEKIAQKNNIDIDEVMDYYTDEDLYYSALIEEVKNVFVKYAVLTN